MGLGDTKQPTLYERGCKDVHGLLTSALQKAAGHCIEWLKQQASHQIPPSLEPKESSDETEDFNFLLSQSETRKKKRLWVNSVCKLKHWYERAELYLMSRGLQESLCHVNSSVWSETRRQHLHIREVTNAQRLGGLESVIVKEHRWDRRILIVHAAVPQGLHCRNNGIRIASQRSKSAFYWKHTQPSILIQETSVCFNTKRDLGSVVIPLAPT